MASAFFAPGSSRYTHNLERLTLRTYIYIDGFNFYYGAVKDTPYKWLDFMALFTRLLDPKHQILRIKYFTAQVSGRDDSDQPVRQKAFIRALKTYIPEVRVYMGKFMVHNVWAHLTYPVDKRSLGKTIKSAQIVKTEEKGSDVNLAVHLVNDAWRDVYDCAVVVSNDSDLAEAMRLVKAGHQKTIGLIYPLWKRPGLDPRHYRPNPSQQLKQYADFTKRIRAGVLAAFQLPDPIPGTTISKPVAWP